MTPEGNFLSDAIFRAQTCGKPVKPRSPRVAGKTNVPVRESSCNRSHAARESGRTLRPVFVSTRMAVRRARSIASQRNPKASALRQPESARNRAAAIAAGHTFAASAFRKPSPNALYSPSLKRRSRRPSAKSHNAPHGIVCAHPMTHRVRRKSSPGAQRYASPRPCRPECGSIFAPSTKTFERSCPPRYHEGMRRCPVALQRRQSCRPKRGLIWPSIRPWSVASVLGRLEV